MVVGHFSVFDKKGKSYGPVFSAPNAEVAQRLVVASLKEDSQLVLFPQDYVIVHLCDFDLDTGEVYTLQGSFQHVAGELVDLIPVPLRRYALTKGVFEDEKQKAQSATTQG